MSNPTEPSVLARAARDLREKAVSLERYMNGEKVTAMTAFRSHGGKLGILDDLFQVGFAQTDVALLTAEWLDAEDASWFGLHQRVCAVKVAYRILGERSPHSTEPSDLTTLLGRTADSLRTASIAVHNHVGDRPVNAMIPTHSHGAKFAAFEALFALGFAQPDVAALVAEWFDAQDVESHSGSHALAVAKAVMRTEDKDIR